MEINQSKYQTGRQMRQGKESNVRDSWVIIKLADLSKIWASGEEKEKRIENVFEEIMAKNFPYLSKEAYPGIQSTECPKQDESQQFYNKPCYN